MPLGNKGNSSGWELKLLWHCPLEDQFGKGKGFGKLLAELVLSSFQRGFLSLWIFLCLQESSGSEFLIRDLGPAQIRGNTRQEKPSQECPKENQTQGRGKLLGRSHLENSSWDRKSNREITQRPKCRNPKSSSGPIQVLSINPVRNAQRKAKHRGEGKSFPSFAWKGPI